MKSFTVYTLQFAAQIVFEAQTCNSYVFVQPTTTTTMFNLVELMSPEHTIFEAHPLYLPYVRRLSRVLLISATIYIYSALPPPRLLLYRYTFAYYHRCVYSNSQQHILQNTHTHTNTHCHAYSCVMIVPKSYLYSKTACSSPCNAKQANPVHWLSVA